MLRLVTCTGVLRPTAFQDLAECSSRHRQHLALPATSSPYLRVPLRPYLWQQQSSPLCRSWLSYPKEARVVSLASC